MVFSLLYAMKEFLRKKCFYSWIGKPLVAFVVILGTHVYGWAKSKSVFSNTFYRKEPIQIAVYVPTFSSNRNSDELVIDEDVVFSHITANLMSNTNVIILSRQKEDIQQIVEEKKLNLLLGDEEVAVKFGEIMGAEKTLIAKISYSGKVYAITIKVVDVQTSKVFFAQSLDIVKKEDLVETRNEIRRAMSEIVDSLSEKIDEEFGIKRKKPTPYRGAWVSLDLSFYELTSYGIGIKLLADRHVEFFLDAKAMWKTIEENYLGKWNTMSLLYGGGIMLNPLAGDGKLLLGIGSGYYNFEIELRHKDKNYVIQGRDYLVPLIGQFGVHLHKHIMLLCDISVFWSLQGAKVSQSSFSEEEVGLWKDNAYIPWSFREIFDPGLRFFVIGGKLSFML